MKSAAERCPAGLSMLSTADDDPHSFFDRLRGGSALYWDQGLKGWLVLSYELCRKVLVSENLFRHPYADADSALIEIKGGPRNITVLQGAEHQRMHRFVAQLFSPLNIKMYRERHIRPMADWLVDRMLEHGTADLAADFAEQLPPRVFMSLFGMDQPSDAAVGKVRGLHEAIMRWAGGRQFLGDEATVEARAASFELNSLLLPLIRARREVSRDDLMSRLWAEAPGILEDFTEADLLATARELYLAGSDTTVHALANAFHVLLVEPEIRRAVEADRGAALDTFIEEVMRTLGSVQYRFRIANQDIELAGQQIRKNDMLVVVNAAANRDPEKYACPAEINFNRASPRDHLAFNAGPRTCVGAPLAREELRIAIELVLDRLPGLRLDPSAERPRFMGFFTRSFRPLHVLFERGNAVPAASPLLQ